MNNTQQAVVAAIEEQQKKVKENTPQWMVGEQLKEICEREPASAELLLKDLEVKEMSIVEAEKKIKAYADKHKTGNCACVSPRAAEGILREFYGLGDTPHPSASPTPSPQGEGFGADVIDLADFL